MNRTNMQEEKGRKFTGLVVFLIIATSILVGVSSAQAADLVKFAPPVDYSVANTPVPLALGDVTGEGIPDLVAANNFSDSVSVLRNNGNGTFAPAVDYPVGAGPSSVTLGDFDKDGDLDVATANSRSNNVSVLLNKGDGTFVAPVNYPVTNVGAIAAGDVNKDGAPDLVVTTGSFDVSGNNTVAVFPNNGNGTFAPAVYYAIGVTGPHGVTIGDVNKDGSLDVVVSNRDHNTIFVLRNNGNGTFSAAVSFPAADAPNTVITADVDRDGDLDVVTGNFFSSVAILRNNGNGTFAPPETYAIGGEIVGVAAGDIDNDGHLDVVAANFTPLVPDDKPLAVLLNNGDGTFALAGNFGAVGQHAVSVIVADLDGDGKLDVAEANPPSNTVSVLLNQTPTAGLTVSIVIHPGSFPNANSINPRSKGVIPVAILSTKTFDATAVDPSSVKFGPEGATAEHGRGHKEDVNRDGKKDLVLHFRTQDTGIACGDTSVSLTGKTFSGQAINGSSSIRTVGCNHEHEHEREHKR